MQFSAWLLSNNRLAHALWGWSLSGNPGSTTAFSGNPCCAVNVRHHDLLYHLLGHASAKLLTAWRAVIHLFHEHTSALAPFTVTTLTTTQTTVSHRCRSPEQKTVLTPSESDRLILWPWHLAIARIFQVKPRALLCYCFITMIPWEPETLY